MKLQPGLGATARNAKALLGPLLEQSVVGIYLLDRDGAIAYINPRFAELCGYSQEEMIGRPFVDFVADEEVAERRRIFADVIAGRGDGPRMVGWFKAKNGERIALLTQSTVVLHEEKPSLIGIAADVSDRYDVMPTLTRAYHALRILGEASAAFVRARDEGELLQGMCDFALATGGYSLAWVGRAEPDKSVRLLARSGNVDVLDQFPVRWDDSDRAQGPTGTAIRTGARAIVRAGDPRLGAWTDHLRTNPDRAVIAFPLLDDAGVFGSLTLASEDPQAFGPDEIAVLDQLANNIAYGVTALRNRTALLAAEERSRGHASRAVLPISGRDCAFPSRTRPSNASWNSATGRTPGTTFGRLSTRRVCNTSAGVPRSPRRLNPAARPISCGSLQWMKRGVGKRKTGRTSR
jgi:PAS domain S-box-containing protein